MKKLNFIVALLLLSYIPKMWAYDFKSDGLYYNILSDGKTVEVTYQDRKGTSNYSDLTKVTIPSTVKHSGTTYNVTTIGDLAFYRATSLKTVTIPSGVTNIGNSAFSGCTALNSVTLPETATSFGTTVFCNCQSLNTIILPATLPAISDGMFLNCNALLQIVIPETVTTIGRSAFNGCSLISEVTIPNSVTEIKANAFTGTLLYNTLTNWENSKVLIVDGWLVDAKELYGMYTVPATVKAIANEALTACISLESVYFSAETPIRLGNKVFPNAVKAVYVPCGMVDTYSKAETWTNYASMLDVVPTLYEVKTLVKDYHGLITIKKGSSCDNTDTLIVAPYPGYHFVKWSDGNTDNPRVVTLTGDADFEAETEQDVYTMTAEANKSDRGAVTADATQAHFSETITITATANEGYGFVCWADGNTDNPRKVTMAQDTTMTAIFKIVYVVTFVDWDDTVLKVDSVGDCEAAVAPEEEPARDGYTFIGWDTEFNFVVTNLTIKAQYEAIPDALETVEQEMRQKSVKYIENGHIYIRRNEHIYDLIGTRIK